jgi:hypothetical protein
MLTTELSLFPHPVLHRLHNTGDRITRTNVHTLTTQVNANAVSQDSTLSPHGHLFLSMTDQAYQAYSGAIFHMPAEPPQNPAPQPAGTSQAATNESVRQHNVRLAAYAKMIRTQTTLRNQILAAGDDHFFHRLKKKHTGYGHLTVRQLLDHLMNQYGKFTDSDRKETESKMAVPWEGGPLERLIQQIDDGASEFEFGGTALRDDQKRDRLYDLINNSALLPAACQQWRMNNGAKTYETACDHFQSFANDREETTTTGTAGYHDANHAQQATNNALSDLSVQMANLAERHATQAATVTALTAQLAVAEETIRNQRTPRNRYRNSETPLVRPPNAKYCHTHGSTFHTSISCRNKGEGHKDNATFDNMMNGSRFGM